MGPRFSLSFKRTLEVHESCGARASGLGAESIGTANTRREKSLLVNRMTYARTKISRNESHPPRRWSVWPSGRLLELVLACWRRLALAYCTPDQYEQQE